MSEGSRERQRGRERLLEARDLQTNKNYSFELGFFRTRLAEAEPSGQCSGYDVMNARDGAAGWNVTQLTGPLPPLSSAQ